MVHRLLRSCSGYLIIFSVQNTWFFVESKKKKAGITPGRAGSLMGTFNYTSYDTIVVDEQLVTEITVLSASDDHGRFTITVLLPIKLSGCSDRVLFVIRISLKNELETRK